MAVNSDINRLLKSFKEYWENEEYEKIKPTSDKIIEYYKRNNMTKSESYACHLYNLCLYFVDIEDYTSAILSGKEAADIMESSKDPILYTSFINNLAVAYSLKGEKQRAMELFKKSYSIRINELDHDDLRVCDALLNIGSTYYELGKYDDALKFHRDALMRRSDIGSEEYINNLNLVGYDCEKVKRYPSAINYLKKAVKLMMSNNADKNDYVANICYLASVYKKNMEYDNALTYYEKALYILKKEKLDKEPYCGEIMNKAAELYLEMGNDQKALELRINALNIFEAQVGSKNMFYANCLREIAKIYKKNNAYGDAITYLQRDLDIKSSVISVDEKEYLDDAMLLASVYQLNSQTDKSNDVLEYILENITPKNPQYSKIILTLTSRYSESGNMNKLYSLYDKYKLYDPTITFDEMLILADNKPIF